ncbi:unnamed protein product [Microthlaspi erraticum]|uniref:Uncharacterized protein n=1 Tax=Microthlaspi erraticum TaxID=1685480 RepID=A0A6D2IS80_9BRAS|nr:unnamed protein product [Microthlaspi erraticum]
MKWYIQGLVFGYLSAPQRTGRLGRGLEMGDGHQEHSTQLGSSAHSIELAAPLLLFFIVKVVWLPWPWWSCARSKGKSWYWVDRTRIPGFSTGAPPGQLDPQLDRVSSVWTRSSPVVELERLGTLPPSLRVVSPSLGSK